jgi:hypothetical protein
MKASVDRDLDHSAGAAVLRDFTSTLSSAEDLNSFVLALDDAYARLNFIRVVDTGSGMSAQELSDNFLTIGTPSRKREVDLALEAGAQSPYLGEKGIGRLSSMRLGSRLRVMTARQNDRRYSVLEIDWERFADIEAKVEDVPVDVTRGAVKSDASSSGTSLEIANLAEDWTEKRVKDMALYDFARLTDPFVDARRRKRIALFWNGSRIAIPLMNRLLLENANARFVGRFSEGILTVRMEALKLGYAHPREQDEVSRTSDELVTLVQEASHELPPLALATLGPFDFEVYWYNRRSDGL